VKASLETWFHEVQALTWKSPADVKRSHVNASIMGSNRVVFNIKGNDYRLVVAVDYRRYIVFINGLARRNTI
jgi:mRNA interferase HigB